jgi:phospholipase C
MSTSHNANIYITNNTDGIADIAMSHQYSSTAVQTGQWLSVAPGTSAGPLVVTFETGFGTGLDYWFAEIRIHNGSTPGIYSSGGSLGSPQKECELEGGDANQNIYNAVNSTTFNINLTSGGCSTGMSYVGPYTPPPPPPVTPLIKNVFVLMLENHSFDNLFGFSNLKGNDAFTGKPTSINGVTNQTNSYNGQTYQVKQGCGDPMVSDPGHEFLQTMEQLCGAGTQNPFAGNQNAVYPTINNSGFVASYATVSGTGYLPPPPPQNYGDILGCSTSVNQIPSLYALAQNFVICDNWFSSLPGPTWPNRLFAMGGSSAGLDDSPTPGQIKKWETVSGFTYQNSIKGSIFDLLKANNLNWRIYNDDTDLFVANKPPITQGGSFAIASGLKGINFLDIKSLANFATDLQGNYPYQYTWIEPNYGNAASDTYSNGSSQHPMDSLAAGDNLVAFVYNTIRNSPLWNQSVLIITYDEHGGFYDHVAPPAAIAPGDAQTPGLNTNGFNFTNYGVRVPAVIVSPMVRENNIDHTPYDHTSILRMVENLFKTNPTHLTQRDLRANDFMVPWATTTLRTNCINNLPYSTPITSKAALAEMTPEVQAKIDSQPLPESGNLIGFLHIALKTEIELSDGSDASKAAIIAKFEAEVKTRGDARRYMASIFNRAKAAKEALKSS